MKKITFYLVIFLGGLFLPAIAQATAYPITELGSCRDAKECSYYCDVPANAPACWSYMTYIQQRAVLGETSSKSAVLKKMIFPIAELGKCASEVDCKQYCNLPEHQAACSSYAKTKGLLKASQQPSSEKLLEQAKKLLGCTSLQTCKAVCDKKENQQKCKALMKQATMSLPKTSARPSEPKQQFQKQREDKLKESSKSSSLKIKCTTGKECFAYCQEHPKECPGFMQRKDGMQKSEGKQQAPPMQRQGRPQTMEQKLPPPQKAEPSVPSEAPLPDSQTQ